MAGNYEEYTTRIFLNDSQAQDKINKLRENIKQYRKDKEAALSVGGKEGDKAWRTADKNIRSAETELKKLSTTAQSVNRVLANLNTSSVKDIRQTIKAINKELSSGRVTRNSAEWKALTAQLIRAKTELAGIEAESRIIEKKGLFARMTDSLNKNWGAITQFVGGITMLSMTIRQTTNSYAQMEEEMANVRKYTGQTAEEVKAMNEEFKAINTRTSREELNQLAGAAGRLGITAHDDIMEFVDAADKINVALGEDLGEDAVATIGKLAMAFGEDETMGLRGAMLATGSAVNEMAQNSSASANYLVDFTARLSGVGQVAGMTQAEIIGLGSVMDENMQRDEMASTAISKLITELATDSSKFARIAGIDVKKFADLVEHDMNGALLTLAKSLKGKGGLMQLAPMFAEMGLDGSRAVGVLTVLANKVNDVKKNQELATKAYKEGNSVINEFNVQNNTVQAGIDKNVKKFKDLSIELGEKLLPVVKYTISGGSLLVKVLSTLITFVTKYRATIISLTAATTALYVIQKKKIILDKLQVFWNEAIIASSKKLWKVLVSHPYAALAVAITGLIGIMIDLNRKTKDVTESQKAMDDIEEKAAASIAMEQSMIQNLTQRIHDNKLSVDDRRAAIEQLRRIAPDYHAKISTEGKLYDENTESLKKYNEQLKRKAILEGAKDVLRELGRKNAELERKKRQKQRELDEKGEDKEKNRQIADVMDAFGMGSGDVSPQRYNVSKIAIEEEIIMKEIKRLNDEIKENNLAIKDVENYVIETQAEYDKEDKKTKKVVNSHTGSGAGHTGGGHTGGGHTGGGHNDDKHKRLQEADKKEQDELKKHLYELDALYAKGELNYTDYIQKQKDLQLGSLAKRKEIWKGEEHELNLIGQLENNILEQYSLRMQRMSDQRIKRDSAIREAHLNAMFYDKSSEIYMNEDALNEAIFQNEMRYFNEMMDKRAKGSEEYMELEAEKSQRQMEHKYEQIIHYHEMLAQYKRDWGEKSNEEEMQIALNGLEELLKKKLISITEYERMKLNIQGHYAITNTDKFNSDVNDVLNMAKGKAGDAADPESDNFLDTMFGNDLENWRNINEQLTLMEEQGVITHAEANAAKAQNDADYLDTLLSRTQMMYDMINNVVNAAAAYSKACSDLEVKNIEKNYDKQIKAAGNNSKKKERLEKKRDEEIRKAKTKANSKAMKIQIAQAIATSAMSALEAYASVIKALPYPANMVMAPVAAGMALAAGALQIATIKKQNAAQEAGYYEGGFTGGRNYRKRAGVVHEGEFVANHQTVANPNILPALELIDAAQRNNTVATLTSADITRAMGGSQTVTPVINVTADNSELSSAMEEMSVTVNELKKLLESGDIKTYVMMEGDLGIYKQTKRYERLLKNK